MKNLLLIFSTLTCLLFVACKHNKDNSLTSKATIIHPTEKANSLPISDSLNEVVCNEFEKRNPDPDSEDSILIQICYWHNYKFVSTGHPDYKGRYSYEYQIFRMVNKKAKTIKNSDIFNNNIVVLEKKINVLIAKSNEEDDSVIDNMSCLEGFDLPYFKMNQMGISFSDKKEIEFHVTFGLSDACMNVDGAIIDLPIEEVLPYLK